MTEKQITKIARALARRMHGSGAISNAPKGLPTFKVNEDNTPDAYRDEGLNDPGIQNMVTGNGAGPVIGGQGRLAIKATGCS